MITPFGGRPIKADVNPSSSMGGQKPSVPCVPISHEVYLLRAPHFSSASQPDLGQGLTSPLISSY
jgi:3',5'-cyclic AMP phosphodiesterase CpdA